MNDLQSKIKSLFQKAAHILVLTHVRPDGDAIGSMLGLGLALQDSGKKVEMVLPDGLPRSFRHLPGSEQIRSHHGEEPDLVIVVDASDMKRTGTSLPGRQPDLVIDHHLTNDQFGKVNLVEADAVATASVLARHMAEWGLTIGQSVAANLLTGLLTDTLGFRTSNVTPEALRQAADLLETGAEMSALYFHSLVRRTFKGALYWGAGLSSLQLQDGVVWGTLTLAARKASGYTGNDDDDLISVLSAIEEAEVAVLFVEQSKTRTKVSWRGLNDEIDVSAIALEFGGGGHKAAAGADIEGSLAEIQKRVLERTRIILKNTLKNKSEVQSA